MTVVLQKRGRYMTGHSYATGIGYSFSWSADQAKARRFADDDPYADLMAMQTGAKAFRVESTRRELRQLGKRLMKSTGRLAEPGSASSL